MARSSSTEVRASRHAGKHARSRRASVTSSAIRSIGYDEKARTLDVEYDGGAVYRYFQVRPDIHRQLMEAESKGRFVNYRIKPAYRYERLAR